MVYRKLKIPGGPEFDVLQMEGIQSFVLFRSLDDINSLESLAESENVIFDGEEMTKRQVLTCKYIGRDYIARGVTIELSEQHEAQKFALLGKTD